MGDTALDVGQGSGHDVRPVDIRIPESGRRHAVVDLPDLHGLSEETAAVVRANFYQLARKLEDMRAALAAMGISITQEK